MPGRARLLWRAAGLAHWAAWAGYACLVGPLGHHQRINFEASQVQPRKSEGLAANEDQYLASELRAW